MIKCSCSIDEQRAKLLRTGGVFHLILNALNQSIAYYNTTQTFETVLKQSLCRYIVGFYCKIISILEQSSRSTVVCTTYNLLNLTTVTDIREMKLGAKITVGLYIKREQCRRSANSLNYKSTKKV